MHPSTIKKEIIDEMQKCVKERLPRRELHKCDIADLLIKSCFLKLATFTGQKTFTFVLKSNH